MKGYHMDSCVMKYSFLLYLFILGLSSYACFSDGVMDEYGSRFYDTATRDLEGVMEQEIDELGIDDLMRTSKLLVIDFFSPMCGPCQALKPIFIEIANTYQEYADFVMIDGSKYPECLDPFAIEGFPTVVIMSQGEVLEKIIGLQTKEYLEDRIIEWVSRIRMADLDDEQYQEECDQLYITDDDDDLASEDDNSCVQGQESGAKSKLQCDDTGCYVR
jgi:thiol-disulfide isomerase/thioredoxin